MPTLSEKLKISQQNNNAPVDEYAGLTPEQKKRLVHQRMSEADSGAVDGDPKGLKLIADSALDAAAIMGFGNLIKGIRAAPSVVTGSGLVAMKPKNEKSIARIMEESGMKPDYEGAKKYITRQAESDSYNAHRKSLADKLKIGSEKTPAEESKLVSGVDDMYRTFFNTPETNKRLAIADEERAVRAAQKANESELRAAKEAIKYQEWLKKEDADFKIRMRDREEGMAKFPYDRKQRELKKQAREDLIMRDMSE